MALSTPPRRDKRHVPRIEGLSHPFQCTLGGHAFETATLRDLALDSLRFEITDEQGIDLTPNGTEFQGHVPALGLYLHCPSRIVRTYMRRTPLVRVQGIALRLLDLDPAVRAQIRSLYPPGTVWSEAQS